MPAGYNHKIGGAHGLNDSGLRLSALEGDEIGDFAAPCLMCKMLRIPAPITASLVGNERRFSSATASITSPTPLLSITEPTNSSCQCRPAARENLRSEHVRSTDCRPVPHDNLFGIHANVRQGAACIQIVVCDPTNRGDYSRWPPGD